MVYIVYNGRSARYPVFEFLGWGGRVVVEVVEVFVDCPWGPGVLVGTIYRYLPMNDSVTGGAKHS